MYWLSTVQTVYHFTKTTREDFNVDVSPGERSNMREFEASLRGIAEQIITCLFELLDRVSSFVIVMHATND
jgi:hypothetical protein